MSLCKLSKKNQLVSNSQVSNDNICELQQPLTEEYEESGPTEEISNREIDVQINEQKPPLAK